jgi:hypothetical protein
MSETDLAQSLARLQAQVATLQEQLTQLALEVLRERQQYTEQRLLKLEALVTPARERSPSPPARQSDSVTDLPQAHPSRARRSPRPAPGRGRSRVLPLIAATATGTYVVICPTQGELPFPPASPEWFGWLATLTSFRFQGQQGRLSTYRNPGRCMGLAVQQRPVSS